MKFTTLPKIQGKHFVVEKEWFGDMVQIQRLHMMSTSISIAKDEIDELIEMLITMKMSLKAAKL